MAALSVSIPSTTATKDIQEVNVSQEDQMNINKFARGSLKLNELTEEIKDKEVIMKLLAASHCVVIYLVIDLWKNLSQRRE